MKLSVVPEESLRWKVWIVVAGSVVPELSAAIAGSFHLVILPEKICAIVGADSCRLVTPLRWYATAIGPTTIGRSTAWPDLQRLSAEVLSEPFSGESEPAKTIWPWLKLVTPAPDPVGL